MAKMPPYSAVANYAFGNSSLFIVEFMGDNNDKLNVIGGTFPATQVSVKGAEPQFEETEIGPGIPLSIYKGSLPPTKISVSFVDNEKDDLYKFIDRWCATGKFDGTQTQYKKINKVGSLPNNNMKMVVTEFDSQGNEVQKNTYIVQAPSDALSKDLGKADVKSYSIDFKIVGLI